MGAFLPEDKAAAETIKPPPAPESPSAPPDLVEVLKASLDNVREEQNA